MIIPVNKDEITIEWFQKALENAGENVIVENVKTEIGTKPGENFVAEVFRSTVTGSKDGIPWKSSYIIKISPEKDWIKKLICDTKIFNQEVEAYAQIFPDMIKIQGNEPKVFPDTCRCIFADVNADNYGILVLEDLKLKGYQIDNIKKGQDLDHCKLAMDSLAKFHALGYKLKYTLKEPITEKYENLKHVFFSECKEMLQQPTQTPFHLSCLNLKNIPGKEHLGKLLEEVGPEIRARSAMAEAIEPFSTICHGDSWNNNMMFKYTEDGKPESVILLDFQVMHYGLPTRDLGYFFCVSTKGELRKKHMKQLMMYYHGQLFKYLDTLGVKEISPENYSFDVLWKMYYTETVFLGLNQALEGVVFHALDEEDKVAPKNMEGGSWEETWGVFQETFKEKVISNGMVSERLVDLLEEMIEEGTFDVLASHK